MKRYEFKIEQAYIGLFFPPNRIKQKIQTLQILFETVRYLGYLEPAESVSTDDKIVLLKDKMSRVFFVTNGKYYSLNFPFFISEDSVYLKFSYRNMFDIDSEIISYFLAVLNDSRFKSNYSLDFIEPISEIEENNENIWQLLREMLLIEDGYLRFDNDPVEAKSSLAKGFPHRHPENHIDIFYDSDNSFKLGFENRIKCDDFIECINVNVDCHYLRKII